MGGPGKGWITLGPTIAPVSPVGNGTDRRWAQLRNTAPTAGMRIVLSGGSTFTLDHQGNMTVVAPTGVTFTTPKASFSGDIEVAGDVKAGTVSLKHHKHTGVQAAAAQSGEPVA